jgi:hypothetical protein
MSLDPQDLEAIRQLLKEDIRQLLKEVIQEVVPAPVTRPKGTPPGRPPQYGPVAPKYLKPRGRPPKYGPICPFGKVRYPVLSADNLAELDALMDEPVPPDYPDDDE